MGRSAASRNLLLSTNPRYAYEVAAVEATRLQPRRHAFSGNLAILLAVTIGLLDVACVAIATNSNLLVEGNALARMAIERNGAEILATYRWTTLTVGLLLVLLGIRSAATSSSVETTRPAGRVYLKAALSGLNAAGIALLAWWTAWIFV